jgi:ABC-type branched-subunit amino acid transport system substrate-binding protein
MTVAHQRPHDIDPTLLDSVRQRGGAKLGITANLAAHTNELIGGVILAVQDAGAPVELIWRDDQRNEEAARRAARSLVDEAVVAVIGHLSASAALPASEIYADAGVVFLAPGTTHPALTKWPGGCVFRVCGRDDDQAEQIADFIARSPRHGTVGIIEQDIAYGRALADLLRAALRKRNVAHLTFACDGRGLSPADLARFARAPVDLAAFAGIHEAAAVCCRQFEQIGYRNPVVLGDDGFTPNLLTLAGVSAAGVNVIAPGPAQNHDPAAAELARRYQRLLGVEPGAYFLTSYAATRIVLAGLAASNGHGRDALASRLRAQVWHTPAGDLAFDHSGEIQGLGWTVYQVEDGGFVPRRAATKDRHNDQ